MFYCNVCDCLFSRCILVDTRNTWNSSCIGTVCHFSHDKLTCVFLCVFCAERKHYNQTECSVCVYIVYIRSNVRIGFMDAFGDMVSYFSFTYKHLLVELWCYVCVCRRKVIFGVNRLQILVYTLQPYMTVCNRTHSNHSHQHFSFSITQSVSLMGI